MQIATSIRCKCSDSITMERVPTKLEEELNLHTSDPSLKHVMSKAIYPINGEDSGPSPFSSDKDADCKSDSRPWKPSICSGCTHGLQKKINRSSTSSNSGKSDKSSSNSEFNSELFDDCNVKNGRLNNDRRELLYQLTTTSATHLTTISITSQITRPSTMTLSQ